MSSLGEGFITLDRAIAHPSEIELGNDRAITLATGHVDGISRTQLAFYCAATAVVDPIHYDRQCASDAGFRDVVVNGSFRVGVVELFVGMLWPEIAHITQLDCRHRGPILVNEPIDLIARSHVRSKDELTIVVEVRTSDRLTDTADIVLHLAPGGEVLQ